MKTHIFFCMYGKLSITWFFWHLAIFSTFFCCRLMNIFLTQFWTEKLLIHKPQPRQPLAVFLLERDGKAKKDRNIFLEGVAFKAFTLTPSKCGSLFVSSDIEILKMGPN